MKTIGVDFCDFGPRFRKDQNYFTDVLARRYRVELQDEPDFIIFAGNGHHHRLHTCPRISFSGESDRPDWRKCDYALSCHYLDDPRHFRLPLYVTYFGGEHLVKQPDEPARILAEKTKFCAFVVGNRRARKRIEFFEKLSCYKKVDSAGRHLNNLGRSIGDTPEDKVAFLSPYKFNLCFENESVPGYVTEKLVQAMRARCVPIYWGSPRVHEEFNPGSFLNRSDFPSDEALIERIIQLDQDDNQYREMLRQPFFHGNIPNEVYQGTALLDFFDRVLTSPIRPVSLQRRWFQFGSWVLARKNRPWPGWPWKKPEA